jgi:hypothetical protein
MRGHSVPRLTAPRLERLTEGIRLSDLAAAAGLSLRAISEHERGIRPLPPDGEQRRRDALDRLRREPAGSATP